MTALALVAPFVREAFRTRLFVVAALFAGIAMALTFVIGPLSLGTGDRIARDFALALSVLVGAIMLFTGGVHLVAREIERRTVHVILSRPIGRAGYVIGKFAALTATAWIVLGITLAIVAIVFAVRGLTPDVAMGQAVLLAAVELLVLASVVTFLCTVATAIPAMLYAVGVFVAGHTMRDLFALSAEAMTPFSQALLSALRWVIPDLARFDMRLEAVHGVSLPPSDLTLSIAYGLVYAGAMLALAVATFRRKELA